MLFFEKQRYNDSEKTKGEIVLTIQNEKFEKMNCLATKDFNTFSEMEQRDFINEIYTNVRKYTHHCFNKLGRPLTTTLQKDVFDNIVQEVTFSLVDTIRKQKFDSNVAKFSTILATFTQNRIFKEHKSQQMSKRKGTQIPLEINNKDGTTVEYLTSDDNVEDEVLDNVEQNETANTVRNAIEKLKPREQVVIKMRMHDKTLEEIGQEIGVSRERVRQILIQIFDKMKKIIEKDNNGIV
jgi:RNA polymerase sigma factor (sigma-70 family)